MKPSQLTLLLIAIVCGLSNISKAQTPSNPIIKDFGTINDLENVYMPDKNLDYKIVIDLKSSNDNFDKVNKGLNNVARLMNLHGVADISKEQLKIAVVLHYTATPIVLNNVGYQKKYGVDNPNLRLFNQLKDAGVEFYICGQSLVAREYDFANVIPEVTIALSMITTVTEYMMKGYSLLLMNNTLNHI